MPVFELSPTSTVSSDTGVYPLRSSEGDVPDNDSLEDSENEVIATDEAVFVEPLQVSSILKTLLFFRVRVRLHLSWGSRLCFSPLVRQGENFFLSLEFVKCFKVIQIGD